MKIHYNGIITHFLVYSILNWIIETHLSLVNSTNEKGNYLKIILACGIIKMSVVWHPQRGRCGLNLPINQIFCQINKATKRKILKLTQITGCWVLCSKSKLNYNEAKLTRVLPHCFVIVIVVTRASLFVNVTDDIRE